MTDFLALQLSVLSNFANVRSVLTYTGSCFRLCLKSLQGLYLNPDGFDSADYSSTTELLSFWPTHVHCANICHVRFNFPWTCSYFPMAYS